MEVTFNGERCGITITTYHKPKNIAIRLYDLEYGCPYATASVNPTELLKPGEVCIKDYSENSGMYEALLNAKIIEPAHRQISFGPVCMLSKQI